MNPPIAPPMTKPHETIIMSVTRYCSGLNSPALARGDHADGQKSHGADQHRTPPDLVGDDAQTQGAEHDAEETGAEDRTQSGLGDVPFVDDGRRHVAHGLHVKAVHDHAQAAQHQNKHLGRMQPAAVDELRNIDIRHDYPPWSWSAVARFDATGGWARHSASYAAVNRGSRSLRSSWLT